MYLSALLDDVTGTEEIVRMKRDHCNIEDCLMSVNPKDANVYFTGSKAEGLNLKGSDNDYMLEINNMYDIEVSESSEDLVQSTRRNKLLVVTDNVRPAFAMLKCITLQIPILLLSVVNIGNAAYLSSQKYVSLFLFSTKSERSRVQGPSVELWCKYLDTSENGQDNVPSILCKFWPRSAAEWRDRPRHYGWPSQRDKEYIEQFGCHLVPVGHPLSSAKSQEWRLSFSIAERTLVWSFNHTQLQCYAILKLLLKEFVKVKCTEKHKGVLCSYFIKTFLFWQFETTDQSFWQRKNITGCIIYLFHEFYNYIQTGVLRHYFVPRFNLLEIKLTPDAKTEILHIFGQVKEIGISIMGHCSSLSGVFLKFSEIKNTRHCVERTSEIHKRCILVNDRSVMTFLSTNSVDLISDATTLSSFYSLVDVLVRSASGVFLPSSLSELFFKRLYIFIAIRKLYNSVHQGNKDVYYYMTSLSKNVYGTDLTSSKLWLATFWLQHGDYCRSLQTINDILSSIPPYALYYTGGIKTHDCFKQLYVETYCTQNTDTLNRAKEAWLLDMHISHREYSFVPRAIQIELEHCDPKGGVHISPFTYAYYLMFLCYHGLGQYDNRNRVLPQLVDTVDDEERRSVFIEQSCNITGHCFLLAGNMEMARHMFLASARYTHSHHRSHVHDKYNAAYKYLSLM